MKRVLRIGLIFVVVVVALAAINFAPMLSPRVPGMQTFTVAGIDVHARPADAENAERIARRIAGASASVREAFAATDSEPIDVILYPDQWALHRKTIGLAGALLPAWYIGGNTNDTVLIVSPSQPGPEHSRESVEQAAVHEYVHVLTDRRNKALGYWMKEGVALYLAEQVPQPSAVAAAADLSWSEFANPNAIQFAEVGGYQLAWTLIEYLEAAYGWDAVLALTQPGATHRDVLGIEERALFAQWMSWVKKSYLPA
jgi:hypothetical protein